MAVNTPPASQPMASSVHAERPISKNKPPLPKLNIKGGEPTTLTRLINEWARKTSIALNKWSIETSNFCSQAVTAARNQLAVFTLTL